MPPLTSHGEDDRRQPPPPSNGPRQERGARACPRQPPRRSAQATHPHSTHPPIPYISAGRQEFEGWEAGEVGGGEKGPWS